jgi:hypothetical protein
MGNDYAALLKNILDEFSVYGEFEGFQTFGSGHINNTYRSQWDQGGVKVRYTHQRINEKVFLRPDKVMENIVRVTGHLREKLRHTKTADISRRVLTVIPSREGKPWVRDAEGGWWRTYLFVERTHTLELTSSPKEALLLGKTSALFQKGLADMGKPRLYETIPDFHDIEKRYGRFYKALSGDSLGRAKEVMPEIHFMEEHEERSIRLIRALKNGSIPERICHNDTKMNNILLDDASSEALCVIDLDTVIPGTILFDLGDLIRTVTNRALEDEPDLSKIDFDLVFFSSLLEGYLSEALDFLCPEETGLLHEAGRYMTQIMGLRFLTDYLEGDHYYHIDRPNHNLDRCRTQIALIRSMDKKGEQTAEITASLCKGARAYKPGIQDPRISGSVAQSL